MYHNSGKLKRRPNDRFIPRRISIDVAIPQDNSPTPLEVEICKNSQFINFAKERYHHNNYQNVLREVLMPLNARILNFFPPRKFNPEQAKSREESWPVKPRKKPVIGPPDFILDMPDFDANICHNVADWSSKNCLATIFENEIHMWCTHSEIFRGATSTGSRVQNCVKWRKDGTRFAVGLFPNNLGIWDVIQQKLIGERCCCSSLCEISSLEWVSDNRLLSGCSQGVLRVHTADLKRTKIIPQAHNSTIINITTSCDRKFLITSSVDHYVIVWLYPEMKRHFQIKFSSVVRAIAWHPWKRALFATGVEGRVTLWNVNTKKEVVSERRIYKNATVDCLNFNPISGELVVSYFVTREGDTTKGHGVISVLTNIDNVMEELYIHSGHIPYLLWDSEGKALASASGDETLCIWNFFGSSENNKPRKERKIVEEKVLGRMSQLHATIR